MLLRRVRRAVEERLAIDSAPLLKLLFHLVWHHLLAQACLLAHLHRALIVVCAWPIYVVWDHSFAKLDGSQGEALIRLRVLRSLTETVLVLALKGATRVLLCLPLVVLGARLRQLVIVILLYVTSFRSSLRLLRLRRTVASLH